MQVQILKNKNPCKAFAYKGLAQAVRFELTCLYGKLISSPFGNLEVIEQYYPKLAIFQ